MKKGKRTRNKYKMIGWQGILLFTAILFMTIAYAQISGILMKIEGGAEAEVQDRSIYSRRRKPRHYKWKDKLLYRNSFVKYSNLRKRHIICNI